MISLAHAPNATLSQRKLAAYWLLPWRWRSWRSGSQQQALEHEFQHRHGMSTAVGFSTGREALRAVLQSLDLASGDEIIIQAYTCIVVPNAVLWSGAKPIYADIDSTLNIDPTKLEALITSKTRAVIVQHTFGVPADIEKIKAVCDAHGLALIEDCAHALGATVNGKLVGTFGAAAIFSFGRDKIISSTAGGMAMTKSTMIAERLKSIQNHANSRSYCWILQNLLHPLMVPFCASLMGKAKLGEGLLWLAQRAHLLNKVYTRAEKRSLTPTTDYHRLPNAMAALALQQYREDLAAFNARRQSHAAAYEQFCQQQTIEFQQWRADSIPAFLRFTCFVTDPARVRTEQKKQGYILGDWYHEVIMPAPQQPSDVGYKLGSCPNAEAFAAKSLNLPTHPRLTDQQRQRLLNQL